MTAFPHRSGTERRMLCSLFVTNYEGEAHARRKERERAMRCDFQYARNLVELVRSNRVCEFKRALGEEEIVAGNNKRVDGEADDGLMPIAEFCSVSCAYAAAEHGRLEALKAMVERGMELTAPNAWGTLPIEIGAMRNRHECIRYMLTTAHSRGVRLELDEATRLAAQWDAKESLQLLLCHQAPSATLVKECIELACKCKSKGASKELARFMEKCRSCPLAYALNSLDVESVEVIMKREAKQYYHHHHHEKLLDFSSPSKETLWLRSLVADATLNSPSASSVRSALQRRAADVRKCKRLLSAREYVARCRLEMREAVSKGILAAKAREGGGFPGPCEMETEEEEDVAEKVTRMIAAMCGEEEWFAMGARGGENM